VGGGTVAGAARERRAGHRRRRPGRGVFPGAHQAGIVTPAQDRLHFATFDLTGGDRAEVISARRNWTAAAE
jgi:deferrochelatase/peroxidase EfeB